MTEKLLQRKLSVGLTTDSGTLARAFSHGHRKLLIAIGVLGLVGTALWTDHSIRATTKGQLANHLEAILETDVEAMRLWVHPQKRLCSFVAQDEKVYAAVSALVTRGEADTTEPAFAEARGALAEAMAIRMRGLEFEDYWVATVGAEPRVVGTDRPVWLGRSLEGELATLARNVIAGKEPKVSRPLPSVVPREDEHGRLRVGRPTMMVATPVLGDGGDVVAVLALVFDPLKDFTRILALARFGESGETYAFDADGRMLNKSRFEDELRAIGLLGEEADSDSTLKVEVRDPGVDLTQGETTDTPRAEQPLTRSASAAVKGETGFDVDGYRDYRGAEVVGAWTWLEELGVGVVTEVDAAEAFAPLVKLRLAFGLLLGLLALSGAGILGLMFMAARTEVRLDKAEKTVEGMGRYRLERKIGQGGMGTVFLGHHELIQRPTAIKVFDPGDAQSKEAIARFEREVHATCQLSNPHTIAIYDFGRTPDGKFFYAMEYLAGLTLERLVEKAGPLPESRAVALLIQVCESLAEAHQHGMVHRDVKPENVLVCTRGGLYDYVKVLDFGLVKQVTGDATVAELTGAGVILGTPLYMSPEQIQGQGEIDARTDVYAIGGLAYYLLTGTPPFEGRSLLDVLQQHLKDEAESPSARASRELSVELEELVLSCLAKSPGDRPENAGAVLRRLRESELGTSWSQLKASAWWTGEGARLLDEELVDAAEAPQPTALLAELVDDAPSPEA